MLLTKEPLHMCRTDLNSTIKAWLLLSVLLVQGKVLL